MKTTIMSEHESVQNDLFDMHCQLMNYYDASNKIPEITITHNFQTTTCIQHKEDGCTIMSYGLQLSS